MLALEAPWKRLSKAPEVRMEELIDAGTRLVSGISWMCKRIEAHQSHFQKPAAGVRPGVGYCFQARSLRELRRGYGASRVCCQRLLGNCQPLHQQLLPSLHTPFPDCCPSSGSRAERCSIERLSPGWFVGRERDRVGEWWPGDWGHCSYAHEHCCGPEDTCVVYIDMHERNRERKSVIISAPA